MKLPFGFTGPLKKENQILQAEVGRLKSKLGLPHLTNREPQNNGQVRKRLTLPSFGLVRPLEMENEALRLEISALESRSRILADLLSGKSLKSVSNVSFRSSGNSDAAMVTGPRY